MAVRLYWRSILSGTRTKILKQPVIAGESVERKTKAHIEAVGTYQWHPEKKKG